MKIIRLTIGACIASIWLLSLTGCLKDQCNSTATFTQWHPVYKSLEEIRQHVKVTSPRTLKYPGKIYFYGDYVMINERKEGVHIIDNSNPTNPENISFLEIEGNVDMAVKDGYLYADNYIDLLTIDIRNPQKPVMVKRTEDVFPPQGIDPVRGIIVDYAEQLVKLEMDCSDPRFGQVRFLENDILFTADVAVANSSSPNKSGGAESTGIGGSFARFTIYQDYLYTVDNNDLRVFDISDVTCPSFRNSTNVGWGIETIFPLKNRLFIGSNNGMFIYDVSNPLTPRQLSVFQHARACDPVFVQENTAFVTLRDGSRCQGFVNQLDIIDVEDVVNPRLLFTYAMDNPHGLSVKGNTLYLCEGDFGFKIYDIEDLSTVSSNLIHHKKDMQAYDVIAYPDEDIVMVIGADGFYQFDTSNKKSLKELSVISVERD